MSPKKIKPVFLLLLIIFIFSCQKNNSSDNSIYSREGYLIAFGGKDAENFYFIEMKTFGCDFLNANNTNKNSVKHAFQFELKSYLYQDINLIAFDTVSLDVKYKYLEKLGWNRLLTTPVRVSYEIDEGKTGSVEQGRDSVGSFSANSGSTAINFEYSKYGYKVIKISSIKCTQKNINIRQSKP
ncbi:hypothetical protein [Hymenobacter elongatus]|uniref:Lipoprotein n=1 Tax=Hymenobacter elongatus TaxID=877208 RepID=A0A4Z0PFH2_9BACT|nr:hypothetical protein [Hymenobacter elongatus]TGE12621.1 hypothetical protein E5J99_19995 [Hymenobacter elongatus]